MPLPAQQSRKIYPIKRGEEPGTSTRIMSSPKRKTLIIGWNRESLRLYDKIKEYPALNYDVKGFLSVSQDRKGEKYRDVHLLGDLSTLTTWVKLLNIQEILIAVEPAYRNQLDNILKLCNATHVHCHIVSDVYDTVYGDVIKDVYDNLFQKREFGLRRVIDFFGAVFLLILLFPVFIVVVTAIRLDSPGSTFYSQIRVGKDGKPFRIFKFRSMVQDAEKGSGPTWAQKKDPRITKVGRFMRLTRVDELPQLMNILKGDMSFVGPRPERPFFVESFEEQIPLYAARHRVKPGVTGWAQVKWHYDENIEDVKEKLKFDLYYVDNHSLWLDFKIFFLTIGTVLTQKGQ